MGKITRAEGPSIAGEVTPEVAERTYAPAGVDDLAERAYCAYSDAHGWTDYASGERVGNWDDADEDERDAWRAVARDLRSAILEPGGVQPVKRAPVGERDDAVQTNNSGGPLDDHGNLYPDNGSAAEVEGWVAGNSDRARYALERESAREGGPRAGLSAALRKLAPDDRPAVGG